MRRIHIRHSLPSATGSVASACLEHTSRPIPGSEDAPARGGGGVPRASVTGSEYAPARGGGGVTRASVNRQNGNRALTQSGTSPGYARASAANLENVSTFASPLINIGLLVESVTHSVSSTANLENVSTLASPLINIGLLVESVTHPINLTPSPPLTIVPGPGLGPGVRRWRRSP